MRTRFGSGISEHVKKDHQYANLSNNRCFKSEDSRFRDLQRVHEAIYECLYLLSRGDGRRDGPWRQQRHGR